MLDRRDVAWWRREYELICDLRDAETAALEARVQKLRNALRELTDAVSHAIGSADTGLIGAASEARQALNDD